MANNHPILLDLTGQRFGYLLVIRETPPTAPHERFWLCLCNCGNSKIVRQGHLRSGATNSCGCGIRPLKRKYFKRPSRSVKLHPEYVVWKGMRQRCFNPASQDYADYGGRGITICERWSTFANFLADMGERPTPKHTVERKDNNGNYEPDNCYWATRREQCDNRRSNHLITFQGKTKPLGTWAKLKGLHKACLRYRIVDAGWDIERALNTPSLNQR